MRSDAEMLRIVQARARQIQRRRRAAAGVAVTTAVLLVAISAAALVPPTGGGHEVRTGGGTTEPTTPTTPSSTTGVTDVAPTSTTTTPASSPLTSDTTTPTTASASTTTTALPASTTTTTPPKLCDSSQVDAYVSPHQTTYAQGQNVLFDAHAHNVSNQPCPEIGWSYEVVVRDDQGHVVFWIQVAYGGPLPFQLTPGQDEWETFIWDQTACSQPWLTSNCTGKPHVGPGTYTITSNIGGYVSAAQVTIT
jgi:hypothetical protein